jgi:hypothetical protein
VSFAVVAWFTISTKGRNHEKDFTNAFIRSDQRMDQSMRIRREIDARLQAVRYRLGRGLIF